MSRILLSVLLAVGLVVAAGLTSSVAQDEKKKKEKPKGPPRIAVNDPEKLKADPDFAVQGEYEGELMLPDGKKERAAAQVIARGDGKFSVAMFVGGLPGAGGRWLQEVTAVRKNGSIEIYSLKEEKAGTIEAGVFTTSNPVNPAVTTRLEKADRKSPTLGAKPSEGAVVLFGGPGDEANWVGGKLVELSDGKFLNVGIKSKQAFGAFKAHLEFRLPWMPNSRGQARANSGVYVQDRYEIQVLDSFGLKGENNECGGVYTQHKPLVNMCLPPMVWQTYDLDFTPAGFDAAGKKTTNARLTVRHNGVTIHDNVELPKECPGGKPEAATPGPFQLQNHGDPLVYRNIWVVENK